MFSEERNSVVLMRIQEGKCPICATELNKDAVLVEDVRYGKVKVCNTHKVSKAGIKE